MSSAGNLFQLSESTDDHADKVDSSTDDNAIAPLLEESDIKKEEEKEKMGSQSGRIDVPVNDAVYLVAGTPEHRLFKKRWLLLVSMCMLSLSNGMMWLTFSPIPNIVADFYHVTVNDVDWFSTSYFVASLIIGFISIAILDVFGLRSAIFLGAGLNLIGATLRFISSLQPIVCFVPFPKLGFAVAMTGQVLTACAQPFFLYSPAKLANTWFGPKERGLCTSLATLANVVGLATSQILAPQVVQRTSELPTLLWICIIPAALGTVLSISFYHNRPCVPPAPSGDIESISFLKGLRKTLTSWNFLVLLFMWGCAAGVFNALLIILPQYLCPNGYSNALVGVWGAAMIFSGLIGAIIAGITMDQTRKYKEIAVVAYSAALICLLWFFEVAELPGQSVNVAFSLCLFGFFGLAILPLSMEMGVEVTYPVAEATSSGLLWSASQVMGMVFLLLSQLMVKEVPQDYLWYSSCGTTGGSNNISGICSNSVFANYTTSLEDTTPKYWTYGGIFMLGMLFIGFVVFVIFFKPHYKRHEVELKAKEEERARERVGIGNGN